MNGVAAAKFFTVDFTRPAIPLPLIRCHPERCRPNAKALINVKVVIQTDKIMHGNFAALTLGDQTFSFSRCDRDTNGGGVIEARCGGVAQIIGRTGG